MDIIERVLREATAKSKDGRIDQTEFLDHAASSSRYSLFTPMEASIIFHFAGRGAAGQRLALIDFAQLLDPRWRAPGDIEGPAIETTTTTTVSSILSSLAQSAYNFVQGGEFVQMFRGMALSAMEGFAGAFGATIVYPIDLGMSHLLISHGIKRSSIPVKVWQLFL
jgi:solute carrier family 25 (mitochondrial aspartate/glutamate transporter), member 12/13